MGEQEEATSCFRTQPRKSPASRLPSITSRVLPEAKPPPPGGGHTGATFLGRQLQPGRDHPRTCSQALLLRSTCPALGPGAHEGHAGGWCIELLGPRGQTQVRFPKEDEQVHSVDCGQPAKAGAVSLCPRVSDHMPRPTREAGLQHRRRDCGYSGVAGR